MQIFPHAVRAEHEGISGCYLHIHGTGFRLAPVLTPQGPQQSRLIFVCIDLPSGDLSRAPFFERDRVVPGYVIDSSLPYVIKARIPRVGPACLVIINGKGNRRALHDPALLFLQIQDSPIGLAEFIAQPVPAGKLPAFLPAVRRIRAPVI